MIDRQRDLDDADRDLLDAQFREQIFPVLTPLAIDPAHPFPFIPNLGFTIALSLTNRRDGKDLHGADPGAAAAQALHPPARHDGKDGALHSARACDRALFRQAVPRPRRVAAGACSASCATATSKSRKKPKTWCCCSSRCSSAAAAAASST